MNDILSIGVTAAAVIALFALARSFSARVRSRAPLASPGGSSAGPTGAPAFGADGGELVAVIAAAVSAASGMAPGSFRISGVEPSLGSFAQRGFNTPVWGHIDRLSRGE